MKNNWAARSSGGSQEAVAEPDETSSTKIEEAPISMLIPLWIMTGATIFFGVHAEATVDIAKHAAQALLRVTP